MTKFYKTLICLSLLVTPLFLSAQIHPELKFKLQQKLNRAAENGQDGLSAAIIFPNGCIWEGVSGFAAPNDSVDLTRKWHFASNTKSMAASILFQLHQNNQFPRQGNVPHFRKQEPQQQC